MVDVKEMKEMAEKREAQEAENRKILLGLVADGKLPTPRGLTRTERKALDATGFNIGKIKPDKMNEFSEIAEQMYDWIMDTIYPDFTFDEVSNNVCNAFALYTYKLTYEDNLAGKN